mmetsp:Transcript_22253/g.55811  ORF Transcript_22253/g.55811 Transcript_22253/m.55811 type:complete len:226 (+) Transcript_22253:1068-1745(+)
MCRPARPSCSAACGRCGRRPGCTRSSRPCWTCRRAGRTARACRALWCCLRARTRPACTRCSRPRLPRWTCAGSAWPTSASCTNRTACAARGGCRTCPASRTPRSPWPALPCSCRAARSWPTRHRPPRLPAPRPTPTTLLPNWPRAGPRPPQARPTAQRTPPPPRCARPTSRTLRGRSGGTRGPCLRCGTRSAWTSSTTARSGGCGKTSCPSGCRARSGIGSGTPR